MPVLQRVLILCLAALALLTAPALAAEQSLRRFGATVDIDDQSLPGVWAAGSDVSVKGRSSGRVVLAGANVLLDADVADDAYIAATSATIKGRILGGVRAYGSLVEFGGAVAGGVSARGSRIAIAPEAKLEGEVELEGSDILVAGEVVGPLRIEATTVEIAGTVKGPLRIEATRIKFADSARIEGDASIFTSAEPEIAPGAKISGKLTRESLAGTLQSRLLGESGPMGRVLPGIILLGSGLMAGLLFLWLGRGGAEGAIDELIDSPLASGGWGLAALLLLPLAAAILGLTIIGLPVAALGLMALPLLLLLGYACAGLGLGEWFFNRLGEPRSAGMRAFHLLAGLLVLSLLSLVPWAGPVLIVFATVCGFGALLRMLGDRLRGRPQV